MPSTLNKELDHPQKLDSASHKVWFSWPEFRGQATLSFFGLLVNESVQCPAQCFLLRHKIFLVHMEWNEVVVQVVEVLVVDTK